jgi:hypothetical protein
MFDPGHEFRGVFMEKGLPVAAELKAVGSHADQFIEERVGPGRVCFDGLHGLQGFQVGKVLPGVPCLSHDSLTGPFKKGRMVVTVKASINTPVR